MITALYLVGYCISAFFLAFWIRDQGETIILSIPAAMLAAFLWPFWLVLIIVVIVVGFVKG